MARQAPLLERRGIGLLALFLCLAVTSTTLADNVYLKNGRIIRNVITRVEGDRLIVIDDGVELTFPMTLVERIEKIEVNPTARPRPTRAPPIESSGTDTSAASDPSETTGTKAPTLPRGPRKRVFYDNGIDDISFELPEGFEVDYRAPQSDDGATAYDYMNPALFLGSEPEDFGYQLVIWPHHVHPAVERTIPIHAQSWFRRVRHEFNAGPMLVERSEEGTPRDIGRRTVYAGRYWHRWRQSNHSQDGILMLFFPDDFEEQNRFYVFQWFVSYGDAYEEADLAEDELEGVVGSFRVRPVR